MMPLQTSWNIGYIGNSNIKLIYNTKRYFNTPCKEMIEISFNSLFEVVRELSL